MQGITDISQSFASEVNRANTEVSKSMEMLEDLLNHVQKIRI
jgi:hypothetical protein